MFDSGVDCWAAAVVSRRVHVGAEILLDGYLLFHPLIYYLGAANGGS
jgi:hypothetical protein